MNIIHVWGLGGSGSPIIGTPSSHFIGGSESVKNIGGPRYNGREGVNFD